MNAGTAPVTGVGGGGTYLDPLVRGVEAPPAAPPQVLFTDELVLARQFQRKRQLALMKGRASTFLTGPRGVGVGLPTSDIAQSFLLASLDDPDAPDYETNQPEAPPSEAETPLDRLFRKLRGGDRGEE